MRKRTRSYILHFIYFILLSLQVLSCSPGWPWVWDPPALASWVLGLLASDIIFIYQWEVNSHIIDSTIKIYYTFKYFSLKQLFFLKKNTLFFLFSSTMYMLLSLEDVWPQKSRRTNLVTQYASDMWARIEFLLHTQRLEVINCGTSQPILVDLSV